MIGFQDQVRAWSAKTQLRMDLVVRKIVFDLYAAIVQRTPVDTGRARGNYQIVVGDSFGDGGYEETFDKSGSKNLPQVAATLKDAHAGWIIRIVNNLPYIMRLEFGYSTQAPSGMARVTVTEFQTRLENVLRTL